MPLQAGCTPIYKLQGDIRRVMMYDKTRQRILDFKLTIFTDERPVHCDWQRVCNIWSSKFYCQMVVKVLQVWVSVAVSETSVNNVDRLRMHPFYMIVTAYAPELQKHILTQFYCLLKVVVFVLPFGFCIIITSVTVWTFMSVLFSYWVG
jgi:hypothetical protein